MACGVVDSVLAAGLVAGVAEFPVGGWAEAGPLGCGEVCWSISGCSDDFLPFLVFSDRLSPSDSP